MHKKTTVLDAGGGLALVLRGRWRLRCAHRRLAQVAKKGDRWAALEVGAPGGVRAHMDGLRKASAPRALALRHDWGPQYRAKQFQAGSGGSAFARLPPMWASRSATASPGASSGR